MLKYFFAFILLAHGLIHFMGFAKAFKYGNITLLTKEISKPAGILWLVTSVLFLLAMIMFLLKNQSWAYISIVAVILSQVLILSTWKDAKVGSVANTLILIVAIAGWASKNFETNYKNDVKAGLHRTGNIHDGVVTQSDIQSLPISVQNYMHYCNVIGKPKVFNMRIVFDGQMRDKGKAWFTFTSVQYNFFDE
jgi:hypothetical protein